MADEKTLEQIRFRRHDVVISSLDERDMGLFKNRGFIRTAVICEGVTELPDELFSGCRNLRSVTLPESLVRIGSRAFERTFALKTLELPEGLKEIATAAFFESGITGVSIPKGITEIPERAFQGCKALERVSLPQSLEHIGCKAFKDCYSLRSITLPDGLLSLSACSFHVSGLESIVIPPKITEIPTGAFYGCSALRTAKLPRGLKRIGKGAFQRSGLTEIKLPYGLRRIGSGAFDGSEIRQVKVPNTVTMIGSWAFAGIAPLEKLILPKNLKKLNSLLFFNENLKEIELPPRCRFADSIIAHMTPLERVTASYYTIKDVDSYTFSMCDKLKSAVIDGIETELFGKLDAQDLVRISENNAVPLDLTVGQYIDIWVSEGNRKRSLFLDRLISGLISADKLITREDCMRSKKELLKLKEALDMTWRVRENNRQKYEERLDDFIKICDRIYKDLSEGKNNEETTEEEE